MEEVVKGKSTCKSMSHKREPLMEGTEESPVWLENKEGEAESGFIRDQIPGRSRTSKSALEGHAEDFELYPESSGAS